MADVFDSEKRSAIMSAVKGKDTKPELIVRRLLHAHGYRYRLHQKGLPGRPDIFLGRRKKAIFVNGCFWHGHDGCSRAGLPKTNREFWKAKIQANRNRDVRTRKKLAELGIDTVTVWGCEMKDKDALLQKLKAFLGNTKQGRRDDKAAPN